MKNIVIAFLLFCTPIVFAQKDSLNLGDRYADDQIYLAVSYNQMNQQPSTITRSGFFLWIVFRLSKRYYSE